MNILELAKQAGFEYGIRAEYEPELRRFAALIREECAKVCDEQARLPECPERAQYCAAAIRGMGDE